MAEVKAGEEALQRKNLELEHLATRDALSGCLNRRAFMEAAGQAIERASHERRPLGCLMLDIDHFKAVNDTHGHGIGDRVIAEGRDRAPVLGERPDPRRDCILDGRIEVKKDIEARTIEMSQQRLDEEGHRMLAEIRRDETQPDPRPGRSGP